MDELDAGFSMFQSAGMGHVGSSAHAFEVVACALRKEFTCGVKWPSANSALGRLESHYFRLNLSLFQQC